MTKILVLDVEIEKAILGKNEKPIPGIQYCSGWQDYLGMGIACIGAWESWNDRYRVLTKDPFDPLLDCLVGADFIVTFNGKSFDRNLLLAHGIEIGITKHIDLLVEIRDKQGFDKYTKGFKLDDVARANGLEGKSGSGAHAPILWQKGKHCEVIDYCLNDVWFTKELLKKIHFGNFICPIRNKVVPIKLPIFDSSEKDAYPKYCHLGKDINEEEIRKTMGID